MIQIVAIWRQLSNCVIVAEVYSCDSVSGLHFRCLRWWYHFNDRVVRYRVWGWLLIGQRHLDSTILIVINDRRLFKVAARMSLALVLELRVLTWLELMVGKASHPADMWIRLAHNMSSLVAALINLVVIVLLHRVSDWGVRPNVDRVSIAWVYHVPCSQSRSLLLLLLQVGWLLSSRILCGF